MKKKDTKKILMFLLLALILTIVHHIDFNDNEYEPLTADGTLSVSYIDVGQGDSAFAVLPNGKTLLIDAGEAEKGKKVIEYIKEQGADRIDYLIATHPHSDHIGAMSEVIDSFDIGRIYAPRAESTSSVYEKMLKSIKAKGYKITSAKSGTVMIDEDGIYGVFVAPTKSSYDNLNNYSAVLKLTYGKRRFIFMGDAEKESESSISADVSADVIKLGHHGSSTSSSREFMEKVSPEIAIISCGKDNKYSHPHRETVQTLNELYIKYYRTDQNGTIKVITDGQSLDIATEK